MSDPFLAQCCRSIIDCKECIQQQIRENLNCPKCQSFTTGGDMVAVAGLSDALEVLRNLNL